MSSLRFTPRHERETLFMTLQRYGCPHKTWTRTIPIYKLTCKGNLTVFQPKTKNYRELMIYSRKKLSLSQGWASYLVIIYWGQPWNHIHISNTQTIHQIFFHILCISVYVCVAILVKEKVAINLTKKSWRVGIWERLDGGKKMEEQSNYVIIKHFKFIIKIA